jgi:microcystin-dependent protein
VLAVPSLALQLREKHGKTSVRVAKEIQSIHTQDTHTLQNPHIHTHTHTHITKQFKTTTVQIKTNTVQDIP